MACAAELRGGFRPRSSAALAAPSPNEHRALSERTPRPIMPRLMGKHVEVDEALALMRSQHASHQQALEQLVGICRGLAHPSINTVERCAELRPVATNVERELLEHLAMEESVIFPALVLHLSAEERAAIVRELRARRQ